MDHTRPSRWHECSNCDGSGILEWGGPPHYVDTPCPDHSYPVALWGNEWAKVAFMAAALDYAAGTAHTLGAIARKLGSANISVIIDKPTPEYKQTVFELLGGDPCTP